ncbi:MAG: Mediator of RNA polymerase II transcription subunit 7 [Bathelium mastoideum]|nr:MAG: Mediator of RNA polymerase II transcription subunit 7 [Bathelium mastoideum]
MAWEQQQPLAAAFPAPPPFYKQFTTKNIARLKEVQHGSSTTQIPAEIEDREIDLPADLQCLVPPEPPSDGKFRSFGGELDVNEPLVPLKERDLVQLFPSPPLGRAVESEWTLDRASYLKKFAKSILLNFLELVGTLAVDPTQFAPKIEHLNRLFYNSHYLINEYRPHQARETLILMMEEQLARKEAEVEGINRIRDKLEEVLAGLGADGNNSIRSGDRMDMDVPQGSKDKSQKLWQIMDEDLP